MLDNGCALDVNSQILGQDSLDVTAYYVEVSTRLLKKEYNGAAHPHAKPDTNQ
jgi:site-specific recombinase XerD